MSQKTLNPWIRCLSETQLLLFLCILSLNQVLAQYQQQYVPQQQVVSQHQGVPQQQGVPQHQAVPQQQGVPQQQIHSYQAGQQQELPHYQQQPQQGSNVLHDTQRIHDREHLKEHLHGAIGQDDLSKMSEEELQFHYFKMHDNDNNNKLDGSELIKSLIHWHVEESKHMGTNAPASGTTKIFTDQELEQMIDPILEMDDKNRDGFIDYPEFVAAQKSRGF